MTPRRTLSEMTTSELAEKLDAEISLRVRAGAALDAGSPLIRCYTCGSMIHWKAADCGHYIPRHRWGTRWDLRNVRPQCTRCNSYHEGEHWLFGYNLRHEIGREEFSDLEQTALRWGECKQPRTWLLEQIAEAREYSKQIREALQALG